MARMPTGSVTRKSPREIALMRRAGRLVAEVLALVESELRPGVTAAELDAAAERHILASGGTPSFKGYRLDRDSPPFPGSTAARWSPGGRARTPHEMSKPTPPAEITPPSSASKAATPPIGKP